MQCWISELVIFDFQVNSRKLEAQPLVPLQTLFINHKHFLPRKKVKYALEIPWICIFYGLVWFSFLNKYTVIVVFINTMKTTLDLNFDFYQAFKENR